MKIGFDAKRAFFNHSGLGNYSRTLLQGLLRYDRDHIDNYLLYTPPLGKPESNRYYKYLEQFQVREPESMLGKLFPPLWRSILLPAQLKRDGVALFHGLSNELPFGLRSKGITSVLTVHDLIYTRLPRYYNPIDVMVYNRKYRGSALRADHVIAISEQTKNDLVEIFGIDQDRIKVIYQSIDLSYYRNPERSVIEQIKNRYNLPEKYIFYPGGFHLRKNIDTLIRAYCSLGAEMKTSLVILGNRKRFYTTYPSLFHLVNDNENILFIENIPVEEMPVLYRCALGTVYISEFEGFGLPVVESLVSGTPVVVTDSLWGREVGGGLALYVDPRMVKNVADKMDHLISENRSLRNSLKGAATHLDRFSPAYYIGEMINFYDSLA